MKTTIVLAALLAVTPAFAQYGSYGYGRGSPGATMQDYKAGPHKQRTTKKPAKMQKQAAPTQTPAK